MKVVRKSFPSPEESAAMNEGLNSMSRELGLDPGSRPFCLILRSDEGSVQGGLIASVGWGWLHIRTLWVSEGLRGQGYGTRMMLEAEGIGKSLGCGNAWVTTFSYQAPGFYAKLGYETFGELKDCPPGHTRHFMRKAL